MIEQNLTGIWQGLYSYPEMLEPVMFTATLLESGTWLSGSTHEIAQDDHDRWVDVRATLLGERSGSLVGFVKTYDGRHGWVHAVTYEGVLNDDGTEIQGAWTVPGVWSGKFLMIRPEGARSAEMRRVFETVPAG